MKIPVVLVTGFLGSGKTTFLRAFAEARPEQHFAFLVNEYADVGSDSATLAVDGIDSESIVGGSLFCECKAGEFVKVMRERVLPLHASKPIDGVIIETSGIADPEAIGTLMSQHGLGDHFAVSQIITIVSPLNVLKLVRNLPVIEAQICSSDLLILNKCDLAKAQQISEVKDELRKLNPTASMVMTERCQGSIDLLDAPRSLPQADLSTCDANPFTAAVINLPEAVDRATLDQWLREMPESVLRVKGRVATQSGWVAVEQTVDSTSVVDVVPGSASQLVVIVPDEAEEDIAILAHEWGGVLVED